MQARRKFSDSLARHAAMLSGSGLSQSHPLKVHRLSAIALFFWAGVAHAQSQGAEQAIASKLAAWYCQALVPPFDFQKTVLSFPLEKLTPESESPPKVDKDGKHASVEASAKGERFSIEYHYQYALDNVSQPYGFHLAVDRRHSLDEDPEEFAKIWLSSFGKAKWSGIGYQVAIGKPMSPGLPAPSAFTYWTTGRVLAEWFYAENLNDFGTQCKILLGPKTRAK